MTAPRDLVDEIFGDDDDGTEVEEFYPGSRRKLPEAPARAEIEFIADPWRENYTLKMIHGVNTKMYPVGALAAALGVSPESVRYWTRKGYFPTAPYRLPSNMVIGGQKVAGRRLYTEALIDAAIAAFKARGLLGKPRIEWSEQMDLSIEIKESWTRLVQPTTTSRSN